MDLERHITELVELSRDRLGEEAARKVDYCARLAVELHDGQVRKLDGAPYVTHCLEVSHNCLTWGLIDLPAVCAALLHDAIEDAPEERQAEERIREFSEEVLGIVQALSKIRSLKTGAGDLPATYRRILGAAAKDLRVLIVKIFDVLHNTETLHVHGPAKAKTKASLGLIYVGVARRLGMMALADALIARILNHLMPVQSKRAESTLLSLQKRSAPSMDRLTGHLEKLLDDNLAEDYLLEPKKIADFFYLTENPGTGRLRRIGWPVYRLKLLVADDDAAWRVLGKMHSLFGPLPRHVRDYLNAPRINGFRALSSRVFWEGQPLSIHVIRTRDEEANRMGILAQWGVSGPDPQKYMRLLATLGDSDLRMSEVHAHVLPDLLDVYTPQGDRLTFPVGSVVVDFAYLVHTELGERCTGGRINGIQRPPEHTLNDGDVVQVVTAKDARPQRAWLDVVKTARARTLVKQALKRQDIPVRGVRRNLNGHFTLTSLTGPDIFWSACCLAAPEDPIRGRLSGDGRWIVHHADCDNAQSGVWESGSWSIQSRGENLHVTFSINHQTGALLPVLELLANLGINGHSIQGQGRSAECYAISMELGGKEPSVLSHMLKKLADLDSVREIQTYCWKA
ncbi:MAG: bifunctional (p)ppGpp synthetase/guanosine-3',5'-bis(diphosphate) 3'-pyrophosphohydrolase [Magnetococcales bacterium]|nr:bifunctional (p)ppGpp synthetase/guanosine-3',5'-bis(diphosphate) 3'-pyrophosphohydrolase [Magnetococcales bacterium]